MYTLEGKIFIPTSRNCVRMFIPIKSRSSLNLDHVGSEPRLLGQIISKPRVHSREYSFDAKLMKLS